MPIGFIKPQNTIQWKILLGFQEVGHKLGTFGIINIRTALRASPPKAKIGSGQIRAKEVP
jgi:hypothetical protein